jgi:signal transduction histidine kinase
MTTAGRGPDTVRTMLRPRADLVRVARRWVERYLDIGLGIVVVIISFGTMIVAPIAIGTMPPWLAVVMTAVTGVAVALRRRWPVAVLAVVAVVILVQQLYGASLNFGSLAAVIALFTVAADTPRRTSLVVLALLPAYLLAADLMYATVHPIPTELLIGQFLSAVVIFAIVWLAGDSLRSRRTRMRALEERAERLEREQAEQARIAVQNERAVIARELHDIVAHSVSVMVVQAAAARRIVDDQPDEARAAMASIETTGREALAEMRRLLGVLRSDDGPAPLEPQQGLASIGTVIAGADRAGVVVELVVEGEPRTLPPGLDLTAYRIVQEALTNTVKHAAPARATVRIRYEPDGLALDIADDGARPAEADPLAGGHGLIGMEERVRLYGGEFAAGPRQPRGFGIAVRLPTNATAG